MFLGLLGFVSFHKQCIEMKFALSNCIMIYLTISLGKIGKILCRKKVKPKPFKHMNLSTNNNRVSLLERGRKPLK